MADVRQFAGAAAPRDLDERNQLLLILLQALQGAGNVAGQVSDIVYKTKRDRREQEDEKREKARFEEWSKGVGREGNTKRLMDAIALDQMKNPGKPYEKSVMEATLALPHGPGDIDLARQRNDVTRTLAEAEAASKLGDINASKTPEGAAAQILGTVGEDEEVSKNKGLAPSAGYAERSASIATERGANLNFLDGITDPEEAFKATQKYIQTIRASNPAFASYIERRAYEQMAQRFQNEKFEKVLPTIKAELTARGTRGIALGYAALFNEDGTVNDKVLKKISEAHKAESTAAGKQRTIEELAKIQQSAPSSDLGTQGQLDYVKSKLRERLAASVNRPESMWSKVQNALGIKQPYTPEQQNMIDAATSLGYPKPPRVSGPIKVADVSAGPPVLGLDPRTKTRYDVSGQSFYDQDEAYRALQRAQASYGEQVSDLDRVSQLLLPILLKQQQSGKEFLYKPQQFPY